MTLRLFIFFTLLFNSFLSHSQSIEQVFTDKTMTWYGLDFSMAKFIGDFNNISFANPKHADTIRDTYFPSWNAVIFNEKDKYRLPYFYNKETVRYEISKVKDINSSVNSNDMMVMDTPFPLTMEQIQNAVNNYQDPGKSGLGLVYFIEVFDKTLQKGIIHVTFFDIASGKVLMTKRLEEEAGGFGLRNYWVKCAYNAMETSHENWKKWKKGAGVK